VWSVPSFTGAKVHILTQKLHLGVDPDAILEDDLPQGSQGPVRSTCPTLGTKTSHLYTQGSQGGWDIVIDDGRSVSVCTRFTCFTSTKVQMLTPDDGSHIPRHQLIAFAALFPFVRYSVYLLYWYKSANTDPPEKLGGRPGGMSVMESIAECALEYADVC
jgi:hypothetical protein